MIYSYFSIAYCMLNFGALLFFHVHAQYTVHGRILAKMAEMGAAVGKQILKLVFGAGSGAEPRGKNRVF
jgi:hypothetical protein